MWRQLADYTLQATKCAVKSDRISVNEHVTNLFKDCEAGEAGEAGVIKFNNYMRNEFKEAMSLQVGRIMDIPYSTCCLACLPMFCVRFWMCLIHDYSFWAPKLGFDSVSRYAVAYCMKHFCASLFLIPCIWPLMARALYFCKNSLKCNELTESIVGLLAVVIGYFFASVLVGMVGALFYSSMLPTGASETYTILVCILLLVILTQYFAIRK